MDLAFSEPNPEALQRTRAIVVVHQGRIVAERYATGIDKTTALLGWSMTWAPVDRSAIHLEMANEMSDPVKPMIAEKMSSDWRFCKSYSRKALV